MFQVTGCSHHTGNVGVRERLAWGPEQTAAFLKEFKLRYPDAEAVLLTTCNRTEFYSASRHAEFGPSTVQTKRMLAEYSSLDADTLDPDLFNLCGREAIEHLFSVAASVDSMLIGETEILGQVRQAYRFAAVLQPRMPLIHRIFQRAISVARRVARETEIHAHRTSIPSLAVGELAVQTLGTLADKQILVVGAGTMAAKTLKYIRQHGGSQLTIANRTFEIGRKLADRFSAESVEWQQLPEKLITADLVVSATGSRLPVVRHHTLSRIMSQRAGRPLVILDLAIPRDFESNIAELENVLLYSIDDIKQLCDRNFVFRHESLPDANRIIERESRLLAAQIEERFCIPSARPFLEPDALVA